MNAHSYSYAPQEYAHHYDYSFAYASPSAPMYASVCPLHSPHVPFASPSSSIDTSPYSYTPYQPHVQVYAPCVQSTMTIPAGIDRTPLRRHQCFKKADLQILHQSYLRDPHPSLDVLQHLASQVTASVEKVRQWFKNRRHSDKQKKRACPTAGRSSRE